MRPWMILALLPLLLPPPGLAAVRMERLSEEPILTPGFGGTYDQREVRHPELAWDGVQYRLYYTAVDPEGIQRIALALSQDAESWTPHGVVLGLGEPGGFDDDGVYAPSVLRTEDGFELYYSGLSGRIASIGRVVSPDGLSFHEAERSLLLGPSGREGSFDRVGAHHPSVFRHLGGVYMIYQGDDGEIYPSLGLAVSPDGGGFFRTTGDEAGGASLVRGPHGYDDGGVMEAEAWSGPEGVRLLYTTKHF